MLKKLTILLIFATLTLSIEYQASWDWERSSIGYSGLIGDRICLFPDDKEVKAIVSVLDRFYDFELNRRGYQVISFEKEALYLLKPSSLYTPGVRESTRYGRQYYLDISYDQSSIVYQLEIFVDEHRHYSLRRNTIRDNSIIKIEDIDGDNSEEVDHSIRIMSYNVWNLNKPYEYRMGKLIKQIKEIDPDIIGFQEVRFSNYEYPSKEKDKSGCQVNDLRLGLPDYQYVYQPAMTYMRNGAFTQEGNAIFSKYPIINTSFKHLSRNFSDGDDQHQRIVVHAEIQVDEGKTVNFFTTHFSLTETSRARNNVEVADFLLSKDQPRVIVGDFNSEPDSNTWKFYNGDLPLSGRTLSMTDAFQLIHNDVDDNIEEEHWTFMTLHKKPKKRIDFLFFDDTKYGFYPALCEETNNDPFVFMYGEKVLFSLSFNQ
eukprot:TRINITY_DN10022_c0_g1_i1.p1 TRINITY_DN10022_c0_g1~~TRINITY_DN10022_c0_g1_i1.p1  ORF type:complete len:428 (+),score=79.68 TRINITY_DN10022_c0_g1_i1:3-1286(+)